MPVVVVFSCEICGARPDPETQRALERQLLDLRHGEYVDADTDPPTPPAPWLTWHGRGMYGPVRYACGEHRGELKALVRSALRHARLASLGPGTAPVGGAARHRPRPRAGPAAALELRRSGHVARGRRG